MKTLHVPYLPALDTLDVSSIGLVMETKARREYIDQINWPEYPYKPIVVFDIARSNRYLYIRYFVKSLSLRAVNEADDSHVHQDSCIEFFMQREGEQEYLNFEFNCIGTCDASRRVSRTEKTSLTSEEYASIKRYSSLDRETFPEKTGVHSWELLVAIPLTLILVVVLYLGGEVVTAATAQDSISQLTHIVGGLCGAILGFAMGRPQKFSRG